MAHFDEVRHRDSAEDGMENIVRVFLLGGEGQAAMPAPLDDVVGDAPPRRAERGDELVRMQRLRHNAVFGAMEDVIVRIRHFVRKMQRLPQSMPTIKYHSLFF